MQTHPSYDKPLDKDLQKEHRLHRLVAGSAFIFALSILPVAQYALLRSQTEPAGDLASVERRFGAVDPLASDQAASTMPSNEAGEVAGVTTASVSLDTELVFPSDPVTCAAQRAERASELQAWAGSYKATKLATFESVVRPYREALEVLTGDPQTLETEREALNRLIDAEYQPYLTDLARIEAAVTARSLAIERAQCGAPAQPVAEQVPATAR